MRVLHLIDAHSPQASPTTLALLGESLGRLGHIQQQTLILGPTALGRDARAAGIADAITLGVPFGRAVMGWPAVHWAARQLGAFDLIHCWSLGALTLAALAWRATPRLLTLTTIPSERSIRWLRVLSSEAAGRSTIVPISSTIRRAILSGGVPEAAVHVLRPGLDLAKVSPAERAALRQRWGIDPRQADAERIKVVALLCDPPQAASAEDAHMAVGLADETYRTPAGRGDRPELRLLVHPDQFNRSRAERIARNIHQSKRIIQEPALARPWEVLPGCDIALALGPHAGGLSLLWAMAGNVPIVGEATYAISEIVEDHHSALLSKPGQLQTLAHRLTQLVADRQLAWKLRDTARHEAFSYFSRQRYCQSLQGVYEQMVEGRPIDIPALPITGGLRFAGRA